MNRPWLTACLACALATLASSDVLAGKGGDVRVRGYMRSDGVSVKSHMRSRPDGDPWNNWSTIGNVNPYNGKVGTVKPRTPRPGPFAEQAVVVGRADLPVELPRRPLPRVWAPDPPSREDHAASLLACARDLRAGGKAEKADVRLRELIRRFPDTSAGREATILLANPTD